MNRRSPTAQGYTIFSNADGPVDHDVPVLLVTTPDGKKTRAILFGYACHNTTLDFYQFCGDYAGFAQQYIERRIRGGRFVHDRLRATESHPAHARMGKAAWSAVANVSSRVWRSSPCADR
jgi:hypothetical protein